MDTNAGGHHFDDRETCAVCGMSRQTFDDTQKQCDGPRSEPLSTNEAD